MRLKLLLLTNLSIFMQVLEYFEPILDVFMVISSRISVMKLPLISWLSPPHDHDFINSIPRVTSYWQEFIFKVMIFILSIFLLQSKPLEPLMVMISSRVTMTKLPVISWYSPPHTNHDLVSRCPAWNHDFILYLLPPIIALLLLQVISWSISWMISYLSQKKEEVEEEEEGRTRASRGQEEEPTGGGIWFHDQ